MWQTKIYFCQHMAKKLQITAPFNEYHHGLRTPGEEIAFTARPKIKSQSQIYRYGRSIFCLPHRPKISGFFDLCLHWLSVVRDLDLTFSTLFFINKIGQESFFVKNIYFSQFVTKKILQPPRDRFHEKYSTITYSKDKKQGEGIDCALEFTHSWSFKFKCICHLQSSVNSTLVNYLS